MYTCICYDRMQAWQYSTEAKTQQLFSDLPIPFTNLGHLEFIAHNKFKYKYFLKYIFLQKKSLSLS